MTAGDIYTIAGGTWTAAPATAARPPRHSLDGPHSIAVDAAGDLYYRRRAATTGSRKSPPPPAPSGASR